MDLTPRKSQFDRIFLTLAFCFVLGCSSKSVATEPLSPLTLETKTGPVKLLVEIADTEDRRRLGLMHRTQLAKDSGMLFVFDHPDRVMFWMKDTPLPLDIIFLSEELVVLYIEENTIPFSTAIITSPREVKYALEVPAGYCAKKQIHPGAVMSFK